MADDADLTIDQLAQRTGMTVRNLRAHQSRGLLPPPDVQAGDGPLDETPGWTPRPVPEAEPASLRDGPR